MKHFLGLRTLKPAEAIEYMYIKARTGRQREKSARYKRGKKKEEARVGGWIGEARVCAFDFLRTGAACCGNEGSKGTQKIHFVTPLKTRLHEFGMFYFFSSFFSGPLDEGGERVERNTSRASYVFS